MKVLIASTIVPFIEGGGTLIVEWLEAVLRERGHEVDVLRLPFFSSYREMPAQMLALRLLDISEHGDRLVAIRPPAYLLQHPAKVLWFIHHHRGAYDLWGTEYQDLPNTPEGLAYRECIIKSDQLAFGEARSIYTNSAVVAKRLKDYNDITSEILYPPVFQPERYRCDEYGNYILYMRRIAHHKRQHLAVEAMRHTKTPVKLMIAGRGDSSDCERTVRTAIKRYSVEDKVIFRSDWISEREKVEHFAQCLAAIYIPFNEDSYGYPSLEAHHARKCVISTTDAGGTGELIVDGRNGFLVEPTPQAIAESMDRLYSDRALARRMGEAGMDRLVEIGITWDRVVERLLA
jgi:glycosyltransferase involved in cell wall biosynthesis